MSRAVVLIVALSQTALAAADSRYVCPAAVSVVMSVPRAPDGWETLATAEGQSHRLSGATFTNGHPKGQGFLRPYAAAASASKTKGVRQDVYQFPAKYPDGIWLICRYQDTTAIVFKRLPEAPKTCEVSYAVKPTSSPVETISCR
jgi:hypothetical protein